MRILCLFLLCCCGFLNAQDALTYQTPPQEILELVDVERAPGVLMDAAKEQMVLVYRPGYQSIEDLSKTELRLGGLRIDPVTNIGSRTRYYDNVKVRAVDAAPGTARQVTGLPESARLSNFSWSPDQKKVAMTHTTDTGVEVWVLDVAKGEAMRLTEASVNANLGNVINWFKDSEHLLVKMLPAERPALIDTDATVPSGPTVSVAEGERAQNRTYQDLLKNPTDEQNFETLATSTLHKVSLDGKAEEWLPAAMYRGVSFSPDGSHLMISTIQRPFSYLVPYYRFPLTQTVYSADAEQVAVVNEVPLIEVLPQGFMSEREGRRDFQWRADKPHTLVFAQVLDGGDPANEVELRDELFQLEAPFNGEGTSLLKMPNRFAGVMWGNDDIAMVYANWWNTRNIKVIAFSPGAPEAGAISMDPDGAMPKMIQDRNYQDRYSDPGSPITQRNEFGRNVLQVEDGKMFLLGDGFTEDGQFPFLSSFDLKSGTTERLYTSEYDDRVEDLRDYDPAKNRLMVRIESPTDYPNYFFRDLEGDKLEKLTDFPNPFAAMNEVHREVITYQRDDGLELSGTLYLPLGYDQEAKEKVPMILWAYPREFKDKSSAGQNTSNPNAFVYPYYGSPVYWVMRGYAILDDAAFPIVGEGEEEPNDSFRRQLVANAKAAIDAVDALGYIDRDRVAVGGHSYGAFMVANLLSHSDLFAAGIARSGAYNRTLTPFGFQSEERNYWEAPEVYYDMSPFMH
ncbi:MAG: prolyl oligopeptidase family serine peptidase, partial [Bacteroidota bacterium]